jgi:hypothetical protein
MPFDGLVEDFTIVESQTARDLRLALGLMGPNGEHFWQLQMGSSGGTKVCSLIAISRVAGNTDTDRFERARAALCPLMGGDIASYNDTHTFEQVRAKFIEAIALA